MSGPLIAIVGDAKKGKDPRAATKAAMELGTELAQRGARLLVYGGPFLEANVVTGFVKGKPGEDGSIEKRYSIDVEPPPFQEEKDHPKLFDQKAQRGADWEVAFYRAIARADGIILIGGGNATMISGQVAIGARIPILALAEFGGSAAKVWETLSAGEDLPDRDEIDLMARPWTDDSAKWCVKALFAQCERKRWTQGAPSRALTPLAGVLFLAALCIVPWVWGGNALPVWMLFLAPMVAGGAGATIRPMVDRLRGTQTATWPVLATLVLGLMAGGIAGILFVTAQLTGDPKLTGTNLIGYAQRSIPYAVGVGFIAGLTANAVFGRLLGLEVVATRGVQGEAFART